MINKTNRKILIVIAITSLLIIAGIIINSARNNHLRVEVITSRNGWGYDVLHKNKIIIHQPFIPGVSGQVVFEDKSSARKTGSLVKKKLENRQVPTITQFELDSLLNR
jgi:hypothetical protein